MSRFWSALLPDEPNPIIDWLLRRFWFAVSVIGIVYFGAYLVHLLVRLAIAGWNS